MKPRRLSYYRLEDLSKQMHEAQACAALILAALERFSFLGFLPARISDLSFLAASLASLVGTDGYPPKPYSGLFEPTFVRRIHCLEPILSLPTGGLHCKYRPETPPTGYFSLTGLPEASILCLSLRIVTSGSSCFIFGIYPPLYPP